MTASARSIQEELNAPWRAALSREDVESLLALDDWRSWLSLAVDWGLVAASFALVAVWPNPLTVLVALVVIGARQLGLAVLMHEASHRTLFRSRPLNDWAGSWLCAYPIWSDLHAYRGYHLRHHAKTGTAEDPDLGLVTPFPVTRASLRRKVWRDLSGRTGLKFARAAFARTFRRWHQDPAARRAARGVLVTNALLLAVLAAAGHAELWLLWAGAWLTTNTLVTRIRSIAEHALTPDAADPLRNTRTTLARWWERLLLAPNRVNYHLEHHLLMTVPHYRLPRMHALLRERGVLERACVERGYLGVLRRAASKPA
jgi:fatty acid desaturase